MVCRENFRAASSSSVLKTSSVLSRRAKPTTLRPGGRSPSAARLYKAGTSLRCVRSPVAPKITTEQGSGIARLASPSRNGLTGNFLVIGSALISQRREILTYRPEHRSTDCETRVLDMSGILKAVIVVVNRRGSRHG